MLIYRFLGGPHNGAVGLADREPSGTPTVKGHQLVDESGTVIGRIIQDWETAPPVVAALLRRNTPPVEPAAPPPAARRRVRARTGGAAARANGQAAVAKAPTFPDEQEWRRHVKAWGIERGLVERSARGRCKTAVLDAWRAEHGDPVYR